MVKSKNDNRITLTQNVLCGTLAGFTSKSLTAPLDVIKIRAQVGLAAANDRGLTRRAGRTVFNGWLFPTVKRILINEGPRAFWKGNLVGCLRLLPYSTIQLAAFQRLKLQLSDDCGRLNVWTAVLAGAGGGMAATALMYPADTIKTRLITQQAPHNHYRGISHAFATILKEEGITGLYRGVSTTFLAVIPFTAATFFTYEMLREMYRVLETRPDTPFHNFMVGCFTAAVAQFVTYPFDTIRKKMQAWSRQLPGNGGVDVSCTSMRSAITETIHMYGMLGLWRGCAVSLIKVMPYTGIMFVMYETCKNMCLYHNGYTTHPLKDRPHPDIDQSLEPQELIEMSEAK